MPVLHFQVRLPGKLKNWHRQAGIRWVSPFPCLSAYDGPGRTGCSTIRTCCTPSASTQHSYPPHWETGRKKLLVQDHIRQNNRRVSYSKGKGTLPKNAGMPYWVYMNCNILVGKEEGQKLAQLLSKSCRQDQSLIFFEGIVVYTNNLNNKTMKVCNHRAERNIFKATDWTIIESWTPGNCYRS